jgi:hypothetical protein
MKINKKLPSDYFLYETSYSSDVPVDQIFVHYFDGLPSKYNNSTKKYSQKVLDYILKKGYKKECQISAFGRKYDVESSFTMLINKDTRTMVMLKTFNDKKEPLFEITFYYDITRGEFNTFFNMDELLEYEVKLKKSGINLVKVEMGHMDTEEYEMNVPDIDLELNYGTEFLKVHEVILKRLNKPNDKGIILFHGDPGTGKTSYIKYLTRLITDKEILFIPPSMAESLSEPSIIPFLMEHKNSVLIVEDAERVIADREGNGSSMGVSNILNLTDGILGDCLNIQVIATFNMKREKIDQALLRKGRLIAEHKFSKLTIDESNNLLKHIGKEGEVTESMTLADIYNIDEELFKVDDKLKIGFK